MFGENDFSFQNELLSKKIFSKVTRKGQKLVCLDTFRVNLNTYTSIIKPFSFHLSVTFLFILMSH